MSRAIVALMPLRGGSKSIPKKNLRSIAGRPLFAWALGEAVESGVFDAVYVSTDCPEIAAAVPRRFGDRIVVINRPAALASDTASTESVMEHFAGQVEFDTVCLIQATSPLTSRVDFRAALAEFHERDADSLVTVTDCKRFFWNADGTPNNYDPSRRPRRQDFTGTLMENGAFYLTKRAVLIGDKCRLGGRVALYRMSPATAHEVDELHDWDVMAQLLRRRLGADNGPLAAIEAVVLDVDGTLTDGGMYYSADGETLKRFDTRDAHGLKRLERHGVKIGVITAERSGAVAARMRKLGIECCHFGIDDKLVALRSICATFAITPDRVLYIGDDDGDTEAMRHVGFAACPADAQPTAKRIAHYVSEHGGGRGAVRDVCNLLHEAKGFPD